MLRALHRISPTFTTTCMRENRPPKSGAAPKSGDDGKSVARLVLRIEVECVSTLGSGVSTVESFAATWFKPGTPALTAQSFCNNCLSSPGSFMSSFFYTIESDFLRSPLRPLTERSEGQQLPQRTLSPVSSPTNLLLNVHDLPLDASQTLLVIPISLVACSAQRRFIAVSHQED
jgi:hypothetical protein